MATRGGSAYLELSVPVGGLLVLTGLSILSGNYVVGMFTSWAWALLFGGTVTVLGILMLFPDVRLYQYDSSPLEQLVVEDPSEE